MSTSGKTQVTPDAYFHSPSRPQDSKIPTIIFFVTGNPGLISYYHKFLNLLSQRPDTTDLPPNTSNPISDQCVIAGFSLGGFQIQVDDSTSKPSKPTQTETASGGNGSATGGNSNGLSDVIWPPAFERKQIYGLRDQIELCYRRLCAVVEKVKREYGPSKGSHDDDTNAEGESHQARGSNINVILMGHSVGAYIALEMTRKYHTISHFSSSSNNNNTKNETTSQTKHNVHPPRFNITSAFLLTPTILNIAHSPSGRLATPLLTYLPFLPNLLQLSSSTLANTIPHTQLTWLVSKATGMPAGSDGLAATVQFLRSPGAVKQALFLASEEMREIGTNTWGNEIWGVVGSSFPEREEAEVEGEKERVGSAWTAPRLYFWFAKADHWVADATREEIISIIKQKFGSSAVGKTGEVGEYEMPGRPEVVIDEDEGLAHAWCIAQNEMVAKRVREWLRDAIARG